jgi:hypothetical protein
MSKKTSANPTRQWIVPIAVAFIGVIGAITPVLINASSIPPSNNPRVEIEMDDIGNVSSSNTPQPVDITLTNTGFAPATNVTLIVDAPSNIENSSKYVLNTTKVDPIEIEDKRLEAYIPKLVHGSGSIVKLNVFLSEPTDIPAPYTAYVTYDQGSNSMEYFSARRFTSQEALTTFTNQWLSFYASYYALFFALLLIFLIIRRNRTRRKRFMLNIIENITGIRRALRDNNKITIVFNNIWRGPPPYKKKEVQDYIQKNGVQDYVILDDFYAKLDERNRILSGKASDDELIKLNKDLSLLSDNALENIDWGKYT